MSSHSFHPGIEILQEKKLVGKLMIMSFTDNRTMELWRSFMPQRKAIQHTVNSSLFSVEVYPPSFFNAFDPGALFEKWAAIEVAEIGTLPEGMETLIIPGGMYAVFIHKGPASEGPKTYEYIFKTWLPASGYLLDNRPHFALMGEKYKNNDPDSKEEIWIPIRSKT